METQLDFLLYNMVVRNPYAVSTKEKIDRALELLVRHFEVVTGGHHNEFKDRLTKITGWEDKDMPRMNSNSKGNELIFSKPEIENLHNCV
ncbi:hypothetical protein ACHAWT_006357 [Skeletonema menzelii]|eukprot:scaffold5909_cov150-Skeletonema_menzelii.AAC.2